MFPLYPWLSQIFRIHEEQWSSEKEHQPVTLIPEASFSSKAALRLYMERSPRSKRWSGWSYLSPESLSLTTWLPRPQGRQAPLGQSDSSLRERPLLRPGPGFFLLQGTLNFTHLSYLGCAWLDASQEMNFLTWMDMLEKMGHSMTKASTSLTKGHGSIWGRHTSTATSGQTRKSIMHVTPEPPNRSPGGQPSTSPPTEPNLGWAQHFLPRGQKTAAEPHCLLHALSPNAEMLFSASDQLQWVRIVLYKHCGQENSFQCMNIASKMHL